MAVAFIVLATRLINLQLANGAYYRLKSDLRTEHSIELLAPRGEILDRNGRPIVSNRTGYNVYILSNRDRTQGELNLLIKNLYDVMPESVGVDYSVLPIIEENRKYAFY